MAAAAAAAGAALGGEAVYSALSPGLRMCVCTFVRTFLRHHAYVRDRH